MAIALLRALRPDAPPAGRTIACAGLIADTHLPDRCLELPPAVFDVFRGVDLIVHAGDVGARSVLDELGAVAPVLAVRGNDECVPQDVADLPDERVVEIAGRPFSVAVDWAAGFRCARARYDASLLAPEIVAMRRQWALAPLLGPLAGAALRSAVRDVAVRCWTGEQERITGSDIMDGLARRPDVRPAVRRAVAAALAGRCSAAWAWTLLAVADAAAGRLLGRRRREGARAAVARTRDFRA